MVQKVKPPGKAHAARLNQQAKDEGEEDGY